MLIAEALIKGRIVMAWTTPQAEELCVGMEVNMYFPAEDDTEA
jgi:coenzyme PQQ precursor peptide PqqA